MGKSRIDESALTRIGDEARQFLASELPKLAQAMHEAQAGDSETACKGKVALVVEWTFKPPTETDPTEETIRVTAKLDTPKQCNEAAKVLWRDGQMTLL
jgi:hypothetical protein